MIQYGLEFVGPNKSGGGGGLLGKLFGKGLDFRSAAKKKKIFGEQILSLQRKWKTNWLHTLALC